MGQRIGQRSHESGLWSITQLTQSETLATVHLAIGGAGCLTQTAQVASIPITARATAIVPQRLFKPKRPFSIRLERVKVAPVECSVIVNRAIQLPRMKKSAWAVRNRPKKRLEISAVPSVPRKSLDNRY